MLLFFFNAFAEKYCKVTPKHQTVIEGAAALIVCSARLKTIWTHNNDSFLPGDIYKRDNFMLVISMTKSMEGVYNCYEYDSTNFIFKGLSKLTMKGKSNSL